MQGYLRVMDSMCANPRSRVSAHFGVGYGGEIHQYVDLDKAAWHCGNIAKPIWSGVVLGVNPNLYTVGVETEGFVTEPLTDAQRDSCVYILRLVWREKGLKPVAGMTAIRHSAIDSVTRANDPGRLAPIEEIAANALRLGPL